MKDGNQSFKCPGCGSHGCGVTDSRKHADGTTVRRKRVCQDCGLRFTTFEKPVGANWQQERSEEREIKRLRDSAKRLGYVLSKRAAT